MIKVTVSIRQATNRWKHTELFIQREVERIVLKYAELIVEYAQDLVPVKTGALKRSILVQHVAGHLRAIVVAGERYAGFVEFGTMFMAARPYLTPAFEHYRPLFLNELKELLGARVIYHRRLAALGANG